MKTAEDTLDIATEMDAETQAKFMAGARASGLRDDACTMCTRPFLTRHETSRLCPPCRSGKPDRWTPAFTMRSARLGSSQRIVGVADCPDCEGKGVVGWKPGAPTPPCGRCKGLGQCVE